MAKVTYGEFVTNMSGSVGGTVHSRNRGGSYTKNKVIPSNTFSPYKAAVRSVFGYLSQAWRNLTADQRASFNSQVGQYQVIDVLGKLITLSGLNLYKSLNQNLSTIGEPYMTSAPLPSGTLVTSITSINAFFTGSVLEVISDAAVPAGMKQVVEITPAMSPGIYNASNKFRILSIVAAAGSANQDVSAAYVARFGTFPPAGSKIFARTKFINKVTGESSTYSVAVTLVGA